MRSQRTEWRKDNCTPLFIWAGHQYITNQLDGIDFKTRSLSPTAAWQTTCWLFFFFVSSLLVDWILLYRSLTNGAAARHQNERARSKVCLVMVTEILFYIFFKGKVQCLLKWNAVYCVRQIWFCNPFEVLNMYLCLMNWLEKGIAFCTVSFFPVYSLSVRSHYVEQR